MPLLHLRLATILMLVSGCQASKPAEPIPHSLTWVSDSAEILSAAEETALATRAKALQTEIGPQLVIVSVDDLGEQSIEQLGVSLGRKWGVGSAAKDDGVLLIVAPNDNSARIEVGYGLEASLSDSFCAKIMREKMIPRFEQGDYAGGIDAGSSAIDEKLRAVAAAEKLAI